MEKKPGALEGVKILDFTQYVAGPFATQMMADLGAEVIKVERPDRLIGPAPYVPYLDQSRPHHNPAGERIHDMCFNRGKKLITINMKDERQKAFAWELAKRADIIIENYFPGTMKKMGMDYEKVKEVNPEVIYCSISGFGQEGPYAARGAFDLIIQGMSGMMSVTGEKDGSPMNAGTDAADIATSLHAVVAILAALQYRNRTGKGQYIDIAMLDSMIPFLENLLSEYMFTGICPQRQGVRNGHNMPVGIYPASDKMITISAARDPAFIKLCNAIGHPEIASDPRFCNGNVRYENDTALIETLSNIFRGKTAQEWVEILNAAGLPCGPVNDVSDLATDPQVAARRMLVQVDNPNVGPFWQIGSPFKMSETPGSADAYTKELGESNHEVFCDIMGHSEEEYREFFGEKA